MARYRSIQTSFWQDNFIVKLPLVEKGFYCYILANCRTSQCGIYNFSIIFTAIELGCSEDAGALDIIIAKHRSGEAGTIKARWQGKYQRVVA